MSIASLITLHVYYIIIQHKSPAVVTDVCKKKYNTGRLAAVNIVMMKRFTSKVPKGGKRRQLLKQGRIKTLYISKDADHQHIHRKIETAFGTPNFFILDCCNGHILSRSSQKVIDGDFALQRRGCLYLCEVSYTMGLYERFLLSNRIVNIAKL